MRLPGFASLLDVIRRVDRLFENVAATQEALEDLRRTVRLLETRVTALEAREELLIEKARTAAATAASGVVTANLVDLARRIGALEAAPGGGPRLPLA